MIKTLSKARKQERVKFLIPRSVQDCIPIRRIWADGIFQVGHQFSKTWSFTDINYSIAGKDDKTAMFLDYCDLLNALASGASAKITLYNRQDQPDERDMPVICFGLRTDFLTHLFPGSRRLFEVADSLTEIKTVCACGHKATVNARIAGGRIVTEGEQVFLGGNESYVAMCYKCWQEKIKKQREEDNQ